MLPGNKQRLPTLLNFFFAAGITFAAPLHADDTEIFFGQDKSQPNVLFVIDVSGSMGARDPEINEEGVEVTTTPDGKPLPSRLEK